MEAGRHKRVWRNVKTSAATNEQKRKSSDFSAGLLWKEPWNRPYLEKTRTGLRFLFQAPEVSHCEQELACLCQFHKLKEKQVRRWKRKSEVETSSGACCYLCLMQSYIHTWVQERSYRSWKCWAAWKFMGQNITKSVVQGHNACTETNLACSCTEKWLPHYLCRAETTIIRHPFQLLLESRSLRFLNWCILYVPMCPEHPMLSFRKWLSRWRELPKEALGPVFTTSHINIFIK